MFEAISAVAAGWRTLLHISEWTGLSLGALAVIALIVWMNPRLLRPAIKAAVLLVLGYALVLYGDHAGRADVEAQWADARKAAIAAEEERDRMAEQQLEAKYSPVIEALQKQAGERNRQANLHEQTLVALRAKPPAAGRPASGAACELGDRARRVPRSLRKAGDLPKGRWPARG